jgi:hypothetical protein
MRLKKLCFFLLLIIPNFGSINNYKNSFKYEITIIEFIDYFIPFSDDMNPNFILAASYNDTILLISKKKDTISGLNYNKLLLGKKYLMTLEFVPNMDMYINDSTFESQKKYSFILCFYSYKPRINYSCTMNLQNYYTKYGIQKRLSKYLDSLSIAYQSGYNNILIYTSPDIIDKYIPDSLLVK